ncbi:uncharacterized protein LOC118741802 [Rhagoletis pomonella]|uniref:uncharacterized protein LOC118741802 n=1 Tax=Rhagoletis pomonella TaxID=28610 RepID=UPI00177E0B09|nr:uncharacterized protein LOC118741802 [Rhagoletis pomonella]
MLRQSSRLANFPQSVLKNLPLKPGQLRRYIADKCCPSGATKSTKTSKDKQDATDSVSPLKNDAFNPPDFLPIKAYRPLCDPNELFGPGAHKCKEYKNPEYYAYHRFSFFELQNATLEIAKYAEGGVLYEAESGSEAEDECTDGDDAEGGMEVAKDGVKEAKECKESNDEMKKRIAKIGEVKKAVDEKEQKDNENCEK